MLKLFFRNKVVELLNLIYLNKSDIKNCSIWILSLLVGLYCIGFIAYLNIIMVGIAPLVATNAIINANAFTLSAIFNQFAYGGLVVSLLCVWVISTMVVYYIISVPFKFIINNIKLAQQGTKIKCYWK